MSSMSVSPFSSFQLLGSVKLFVTLWTTAHQTSLSTPTPWAYSNSYPSSRWCHPAISSSAVPFSSCLQSFPASWSFPMSQFFALGGQNIGASASSVLPMNIQDWFDWLDILAIQGPLKSLLQNHSSKASIPQRSAFFIVQLSHSYLTTGKTIDGPLLAK